MKISKVSTNPVFRTTVFAKIPKDKRLEELETEKEILTEMSELLQQYF